MTYESHHKEKIKRMRARLKAESSFIHSFIQKVFIDHLLSPRCEVVTKSHKATALLSCPGEGRQAEDVNR